MRRNSCIGNSKFERTSYIFCWKPLVWDKLGFIIPTISIKTLCQCDQENKVCSIFRQQQGDETPMVWEMLLYIYILYSPDWHYRSTMPTFLFIYGALFAIAHSQVHFGIGFKVHYIVLCLLCIPRMYKYYIHTEDRSAKRLAKLYVITLLLGSLCWLCDRLFCKLISRSYFNLQGHALWHVFMGFNSYYANTFLIYCRAQQRGWNPKVAHFMGFFPYVKIKNPRPNERSYWVNKLSLFSLSLSQVR